MESAKEKEKPPVVKRRSWETFRDYGLLWWVNRVLHLLGWAIVCSIDKESGKILEVYPARVRFRGFDGKSETEGFRKVTKFLKGNAEDLLEEAEE